MLIFINLLLFLLCFFVRLDLLFNTTTLQYTQKGPGQCSGPSKLVRDLVKFESRGGLSKTSRELGREPECLYPGPDPPSTNKANFH